MSKEFESQVGLVSASAKVVREKTISEIIEIIEGERVYTGCSSCAEKDYRINKESIISKLKTKKEE